MTDKYILDSIDKKGYIKPSLWYSEGGKISRWLQYNPNNEKLWNAAKKTFELSSYENGVSEEYLRHIIEKEQIPESLDARGILEKSIKQDGEQNAIKYLRHLIDKKATFELLDYTENSLLARKVLSENSELLKAAQNTFDITSYQAEDEKGLFYTIEEYQNAATLLDAENILNDSIKRDGGRNLTGYLKKQIENGKHFFEAEQLETLAKSEFAAKILQENPDIVKMAEKSFNVCYCGFESFGSGELSSEKMKRYGKMLEDIAQTGVFKPYFDAEKLIEESENLSFDDAFAATWYGDGGSLRINDLEDRLDLIERILPRHPELIELIDKSLDIKYDDYNQSSSFYDAERKVTQIKNSAKLATGYYMAGKLENLSETAVHEFEDKEQIIGTYLNSEKLNIFELANCLKINEYVTEHLIRQSPEVLKRVEKLFENPKNYIMQKSLQSSRALNALFDVSEKLNIAEANLRKMDGNTVFEILTTTQSDYPEALEAERQYSALSSYFKQTRELNDRSPDADLCYSSFNKDKYWEDLNPLLENIGTFKCAPEVAEMVEERIGRIFAFYNYHNTSRETYSYSYFSGSGMEHFASQMIKEVTENPDSHKAQFYIKHASNVLSQWCYGQKIMAKTLNEILPQIAGKGRYDIYEQLVSMAVNTKGKYYSVSNWKEDNMVKALVEDVNSPIAQIYLKNVKKYFSDLAEFSEVVSKFAANDKGKNPEIVKKLCSDMLEVYNADKKKKYNKSVFENNLLDLCKETNNPQIVAILEEVVKNEEFTADNLQSYYKKWQRSGLKCYENLVDRALTAKELVLKEKFADIDYAPLHEKLKKSKVESISIGRETKPEPEILKCLLTEQPHLKTVTITVRDNPLMLTPDVLTPAPALERISKKGISTCEIQNMPEVLKNMPNLVSIEGFSVADEERKALADYLLASKPEGLINIEGVYFAPKDAEAVMEKYPLLTVDINNVNNSENAAGLKQRNKQLQKVILQDVPFTDKEVLDNLIECKGVVKCLQMMAPEKRPSLNVLLENNIVNRMKEAEEDTEKFVGTLKDLLQILGVDKKDAETLTQNIEDENVQEAITQHITAQQKQQNRANTLAAFKAWQNGQGIKK